MKNTFLPMLFRMKFINRWGLMYNMQTESLSVHSLECAMLVHFLCNIGNVYLGRKYDAEKLAVHALYHDASEILTGDLPTPIKKYSREMTAAYKEIEEVAAQKILTFLPKELAAAYEGYFVSNDLSADEAGLIKIADRLCAYIKCKDELKAGNAEFAKSHADIEKELFATESPELKFFLEHFIDAFSLSLHEMETNF